MNRVLLTTLTFLTATTLGACKGTKEIHDPAVESAAKSVGSSSGTMASTPSDADEATLQTNVTSVGSSLSGLVSAHQSYATTNGTDAEQADPAALARAAGDVVEWDGSHLVVSTTWGETGYEFTYDVDLNIGTAPVSIDGTYDVDYSIGAAGFAIGYTVSAVYDALTFDDAGCAASGTVSVDWSYDSSIAGLGIPGATGGVDHGTVITEFTACDTVTVSGT